MERINVIGVEIYDGDIPLFYSKEILSLEKQKELNKCISFTGAHGIIESKKNKHFLHILKLFYLNLPDGMPVVWVAKLKGAKRIKRCPGPQAFEYILKKSSETNLTHFFCGGKPTVAKKLKESCEIRFNNSNIVGTYTPPFVDVDDFNYEKIGNIITKKNPDIIWIGISTPKQEIFAYNLSKYTKVKFLITVGAAFDFHTSSIKVAPKWMQNNGLEWLYRLISEPRRLWKRYLEIVPKFIFYGFKDILINKNK